MVARMSLVFMFGTSISETSVSKIAFYSTIMDINLKDVSSWVQEYLFRGLSMPLSGFEKVSS